MLTEMCKFAKHENFSRFLSSKTTKLNKYKNEIKKQLQVHSMQCNILHYVKISLT